MTLPKRKIASGVAVRGDNGVAGEGRVVGIPKFRPLGSTGGSPIVYGI